MAKLKESFVKPIRARKVSAEWKFQMPLQIWKNALK